MTPYEAVHGQQFPLMVTYLPDTSKVHATNSLPHNYDVILCTLERNFDNGSKSYEATRRRNCSKHSFVEDDHVFLCFQPNKQTSLKVKAYQSTIPTMELSSTTQIAE